LTIDSTTIEIVTPALAIGLIISLTNGPLGLEVLRRGIIFIDLAIAHIAGLGLIAGTVLLHDVTPWLLQLSTTIFVVLISIYFWHLEKQHPKRIEAFIGTSFILAASTTFLLLADHPHAAELMKTLLSGQILFVTWDNVTFHAPIYGILLACILSRPLANNGLTFYILFALTITLSVRLVGIYIVFASLILPALASEGTKTPVRMAWIIGITSITLGIFFGTYLDNPIGPMIVLSYAFVYLAAILINRTAAISNSRS